MKVGNNIESLQSDLVARAANGTRSPSTPVTPKVGAVNGVDKVELSELSQRLTGETAPSGDSGIRAEKVEEVRQAMSEGRFKISAHAVAAKMIADAAELIETMARKAQAE